VHMPRRRPARTTLTDGAYTFQASDPDTGAVAHRAADFRYGFARTAAPRAANAAHRTARKYMRPTSSPPTSQAPPGNGTPNLRSFARQWQRPDEAAHITRRSRTATPGRTPPCRYGRELDPRGTVSTGSRTDCSVAWVSRRECSRLLPGGHTQTVGHNPRRPLPGTRERVPSSRRSRRPAVETSWSDCLACGGALCPEDDRVAAAA